MPYLDTSILVSALTDEAETARTQAWLTAQVAGDSAISAWVIAEFSAALSVKVRTGRLRADDRRAIAAAFARLSADSLTVLPISDGTFRAAARLADSAASGLRAGDALHLAVAAEAGLVLATLDRRLVAAGAALGLRVERT